MTTFLMNADLRNAVLNFLGEKPLKEVAALFNAIQAMKPLPELKSVSESEKSEEKVVETFGNKE